MGKIILTVNYSLTKEIGTYTAIGLALVELKFMTMSVAAGAKNKQVIRININHNINLAILLSNYEQHNKLDAGM